MGKRNLFDLVVGSHGFGIAVVSLYPELPEGFFAGCDFEQCRIVLDTALEYRKISIIECVIDRMIEIAGTDIWEAKKVYFTFLNKADEIRLHAKRSGMVGSINSLFREHFPVADLFGLYVSLFDKGSCSGNYARLMGELREIICGKSAKSASINVWRAIVKKCGEDRTHCAIKEAAEGNVLKLMIGPARFAQLMSPEE